MCFCVASSTASGLTVHVSRVHGFFAHHANAHLSVLMGAKQSVVEENAPASPRSPTSPRVLPVDGETSMSAVQGNDSSLDNRAKTTEKKITALEAELAKTREKMEAMETTIGELATMLRLHLDKQQP